MTNLAQLKSQIAIFAGRDLSSVAHRTTNFLDGLAAYDCEAVQFISGQVTRVVGQARDLIDFAKDIAKDSHGSETIFICGGAEESRFLFCATYRDEILILRTRSVSFEQVLHLWRLTSQQEENE